VLPFLTTYWVYLKMSFRNLFFYIFFLLILFAFGGFVSTIPIQRDILRGQEHLFKKAILSAIGIIGILYFLFAFTVVGITGDVTSPDAFSGLFGHIGSWIIVLGSIFGLLAISTSYLMLSFALRNVFYLDYHMGKFPAWLLVVVPPVVLFLGGLRNFIDVIGIVGAIAGGLEGIILLFLFIKAKEKGMRKPEINVRVPKIMLYTLALIFLGGIFYALFVGA